MIACYPKNYWNMEVLYFAYPYISFVVYVLAFCLLRVDKVWGSPKNQKHVLWLASATS